MSQPCPPFNGPTAFREKLVSENTQHFKSALQQLAGHSKDWNDRLGDLADSLRAYLEDKRENTHATFKDSQGWTVFHMICKLYNHYHELGTFHSSGLASLLHCRTLLSYTDAEGHTDWSGTSGDHADHVNLHLLPGIAGATATVKGVWTALHIAAAQGHKGTVECLLESQLFAVDEQDDQGRTALHIAAAQGHTSTVGCLLASGLAAVDDQDGQGITALKAAVAGRHGAAAEALVRCIPGLKPDAECREVLTALVHEQATQGIDHGLSDAMVGLLSQYHDRAWCRPTYQQRRLYNAAVLGSLADLPDTAVAIILQQLRPGDIMRLDAATMAQVPLIHERLLQMRYARRWLQLTRRVPAAGRTPCVEEVDVDSDPCKTDLCPTEHDFQADYRDFLEEAEEDNHSHQLRHPCMHYFDERLWGQLKHASKHSLLQTLLQQIRHINDVAALIDEWVPAHDRLWAYKNRHMDNWRPLPRTIWLPESIRRMRQLQYKVVLALSIGFVGFWDSAGEQTIHNKAGHCEFAAFGALMKPLNRLKNNQLLFLCALHRLQQLPAQAVLARLHGIFSRCCRFDLLMLVNSLAHRRQYVEGAIWPEAHAEDILIAFGGMTRDLPYMKTVDCLTVEEKEQIKQHTGSMVGEWVEMASIWDAFGSLLNNPILSPSWWPRSGDFHNTPAWQLQA